MTIREEICNLIDKKFGCKKKCRFTGGCDLVERLYLIVCRLE